MESLGKEPFRIFRAVTSELRLNGNEWPDLLSIVQSAIQNAPSIQRSNVPPVKAMRGIDASPLISKFYRSHLSKPVMVTDVSRERALNVEYTSDMVSDLHLVVRNAPPEYRKRLRGQVSKAKLPNLVEGDLCW